MAWRDQEDCNIISVFAKCCLSMLLVNDKIFDIWQYSAGNFDQFQTDFAKHFGLIHDYNV